LARIVDVRAAEIEAELIADGSRHAFKRSKNPSNQGPAPELDWAWALTVHKAQGSQSPIAIVPVWDCWLNVKNLIYTAIARGKSQVAIVGNRADLFRAIKNTWR
jgi:ATP-dependent exoDNAse (exonuclease V) alpha subunit